MVVTMGAIVALPAVSATSLPGSPAVPSSGTCNPSSPSTLFSCLESRVSSQQGGSFLASSQFLSIIIGGAEKLGTQYGFPWEYVYSQMAGAECGACAYAQWPGYSAPGNVHSAQNCFNWWSLTPGGESSQYQHLSYTYANVPSEAVVTNVGWRCYNMWDGGGPGNGGGDYDMYDFNVNPGPPGDTSDSVSQAITSLTDATTGPNGITSYYSSNVGVCYNGFCGSEIKNTCSFSTWAGGTYAIGRPWGGEASYASSIQGEVNYLFGSVANVQAAATGGNGAPCLTPDAVTSGGGSTSLTVSYGAQIGSNQIHCGASFVSGTTVTFTASVSGGSGSYSYSWNFGDGSSVGHGTPVKHTYSNVGTVNPQLSVTDSNKDTGSSGSGCTFTVTSGSTGTVNGIDVSSYQYTPNWQTVASSGIQFAWAKATQGNYYQDGVFNYDMTNGKAAGVIMGAYDFADPDNVAATTEAAYFESFAGGYFKAGYLVPALDIETGCSGAGNGNLNAAQISSWVDTWSSNVASYIQTHDGYTVKPIIYTYTSYASSCLTSAVTSYPLWIAWPYSSSPSTTPWSVWDVWQYGTTSVPGVSTATDVDRFHGDLSQLKSTLVIGGTPSGGTGPTCPNLAAVTNPNVDGHSTPSVTQSSVGTGYWLVGADGGVFTFGNAGFYGSAASKKLGGCIVGMAATPDGKGYWLVGSDGGVFAYGDAGFYGSMAGKSLAKPVVGMAATPDGKGYWLVAADGGIFNFGDATFYGSLPGEHLTVSDIVGMAALPDGKGYWLVGADGGVFSLGSAAFYGSMGGKSLAAPVVGMATPDGKGYWLVAADGGIFSFGSAAFYGSMGGKALAKPVSGMVSTPDGKGYWLVAQDGGVFSFGDAPFFGSMAGKSLAAAMVGIAAVPSAANAVPVVFTATSQTSGCGSGCNIWSAAHLSLSVSGPSGAVGTYTANTAALLLEPGTQYTVQVSVGNSAYSVGSWSDNNFATLIVSVGGTNHQYSSKCGTPTTTPGTSAKSALLDTGTAWSSSCQASPPLGEHVNVNIVSSGGGSSQCSQATAVTLGKVVTGTLSAGGCVLFSVAITQTDWNNWGYLDAYEVEGSGAFQIAAGMSPPTVTAANARAVAKGPDAAVSVPLTSPLANQWMGWGTYEYLVTAPGTGGSYCFVTYLSNLEATPSASCATHVLAGSPLPSSQDAGTRTLSVPAPSGVSVAILPGNAWLSSIVLLSFVGIATGLFFRGRRTERNLA